MAFGLATGGVLCPVCRPGQPHVVTLPARTIEAVRALASPGTEWREIELAGASLASVRQTVGGVISHVLGHRPRVWPLLGV